METPGQGFTDITADVAAFLAQAKAGEGTLLVYLRHTSASLTIQENADPDVQADLISALDRLAPENAPWIHDVEGPDDMPAHVKAMLTGVSLHVPVVSGKLALGTWQGIYLVEHRRKAARPRGGAAIHRQPALVLRIQSGKQVDRPFGRIEDSVAVGDRRLVKSRIDKIERAFVRRIGAHGFIESLKPCDERRAPIFQFTRSASKIAFRRCEIAGVSLIRRPRRIEVNPCQKRLTTIGAEHFVSKDFLTPYCCLPRLRRMMI